MAHRTHTRPAIEYPLWRDTTQTGKPMPRYPDSRYYNPDEMTDYGPGHDPYVPPTFDLLLLQPGGTLKVTTSSGAIYWITATIFTREQVKSKTVSNVSIVTTSECPWNTPPNQTTLAREIRKGQKLEIKGRNATTVTEIVLM